MKISGIAAAIVAGCLSCGVSAATLTVPGYSNPWLAGMPAGETAQRGDTAPGQSPVEAPAIVAGATYNFSVSGWVRNLPATSGPDPDGGSVWPHRGGAENGISALLAPSNSLIGVFLGPDRPDGAAAPAGLNFSTAASRDFTTLAPQLRQTFFIGDGLTATALRQGFRAPAGATRLFLGTMDGYGWANNSGAFTVDFLRSGSNVAAPVPAPAPLALMLLGAATLAGLRRRR